MARLRAKGHYSVYWKAFGWVPPSFAIMTQLHPKFNYSPMNAGAGLLWVRGPPHEAAAPVDRRSEFEQGHSHLGTGWGPMMKYVGTYNGIMIHII